MVWTDVFTHAGSCFYSFQTQVFPIFSEIDNDSYGAVAFGTIEVHAVAAHA
jgi:hypothetical protein